MSNVAIIDVDDTLFNLREPMCEALNKHTGKNIHFSEWDSYDLHTKYEISLEEFFQVLTEHEALEYSRPECYSLEFIERLQLKYPYPLLLTARGWHPRGKDITEGMLQIHGFASVSVQCLTMGQCKADFIEYRYGDIGLFVEDNPKHFESVLTRGLSKNCFLIERPWNKNFRDANPDYSPMFCSSLMHVLEAVGD